MYILLIARGIPTKKDPIWGCFEFDHARALSLIGHKVVVLSVDERIRFYKRKIGITYQNIEGVDCYSYRLIPKKISNLFGFKFSTKISVAQYNYLLKKIIEKHGTPDIIYSHYLTISHLAVYVSKKFHIPLVAIEHWSEVNKETLSANIKKLGDLTYCNVDQLISVSEPLRNVIRKHFAVDSVVVHNMVGDDFCNQQINLNFVDKVRFVTIGRLVFGKGFDLLLKAFAKLNLQNEKWEMNVIGCGVEYDNLKKQIVEVGLQDNIHLLGSKTKVEIVDILRNSDVFVLASRKETFGVVYIEAMMMGLPIIATICGGPEGFVRETEGLLVPVDDVDALADAIKYMFDNYKSYDRQKIAEDCKNRFSPEVIAHQLTDVFESVS